MPTIALCVMLPGKRFYLFLHFHFFLSDYPCFLTVNTVIFSNKLKQCNCMYVYIYIYIFFFFFFFLIIGI